MASEHMVESHLLAGVDAPPLGSIAGMSVLTATAQHHVPFADRIVPRRPSGSFFAELGDDPAADDSEAVSRAMLREALDAAPELLEQARTDEDFAPLRDDPRFKELVAE